MALPPGIRDFRPALIRPAGALRTSTIVPAA